MSPSRSVLRRRAALALGTLALLAAWAPAPATAQADYPTGPVTLVVPFPAGGSTDLVARLVAAGMSKNLGQQVVVENRGGAGGNIGAAAVTRAAPDGYTILMGTVATQALNPALYKKMPYDAVEDFAPISLLALIPNVLVVNPDFPARSVPELIDLLKAHPGEYSYASSGNGTPLHLSGELFKTLAGVDMVHVPYKGAGPALVDVIAGHVPIMFDNLPPSLEQIRAGKLRGLAVTTATRSPALPDLPTIAEAGVPGYEAKNWYGILAPAATPPAVVEKLNRQINDILRAPDFVEAVAKQGAEAEGGTSSEFKQYLQSEIAKWTKVIRSAGVQL
jgi:tripartite-type tricarboxylate transporter receptor subunit TctC